MNKFSNFKLGSLADLKIIFILALICLMIISIWFKDGMLLATGEEGLILTNPSRVVDIYKYSWNEVGIGNAIPGTNPVIPFFIFENKLLQSGINLCVIQATIFFVLMFIGSACIYFLSKKLFNSQLRNDMRDKFALLAALFYIFNPISFLGVWYRFLLGFMFFYALAPLFFLLYYIGINNRKIYFALLIPLISLLFSFAFTGPSFVLLLWLLPFLYTLVLSFNKSSNRKITLNIFPIIFFVLTFAFWVLVNLWWIMPYIELSKLAFSAETSLEHAIGTLRANSADFNLFNVIRLIHGGFLYRGEVFGSIYKTPFFIILSWIIPLVTVYGLIKFKRGKQKLFLVISFILLLYLVKGTAAPLGGLFLWFFSHIAFLQAYRNPLEKIGLLLPIIYAPLFSLGLYYLVIKIQNFKKRLIFIITVVSSLFIFSWPLITGAIAVFGSRDIRVEVPDSFKAANLIIPPGNHIIYSIPQMGGASGRYKWKYGYAGVDASEFLFNYPVITKIYDVPSFFGQLSIAESTGKVDNNLIGMAQLFSADIIALRQDTDLPTFGYNLEGITRGEQKILDSKLTRVFDSREFSLWSLPEKDILPVIYAPTEVKFGDSPAELINLLQEKKYDPKRQTFICANKDKCIPNLGLNDLSQLYVENIPDSLKIEKISPVNYQIGVNNSKGRFLLVFNNGYHPGWQVKVGEEITPDENHFVANGYANGFIIDKKGSYNISLYFSPEKKLAESFKISFWSVIAGITLLLLLKFGKRAS